MKFCYNGKAVEMQELAAFQMFEEGSINKFKKLEKKVVVLEVLKGVLGNKSKVESETPIAV